jgi:hypothetical protein
MSTQYRLVQSGKTASGGCSAGPRFVRAVAPRIYLFITVTEEMLCSGVLVGIIHEATVVHTEEKT